MTDFWQGFITAVALIAVSIIVASMVYTARKAKAGRRHLAELLTGSDEALIEEFQALRLRVALTPGPTTPQDDSDLASLLKRFEARGIDVAPLLTAPLTPPTRNAQGKKGIH